MHELEKNISDRIHEFDIISLLYLLKSLGYGLDEIRFKGQNDICSQSSLISKIRFRQEPLPEVEITLTMGLLSAQSPLPSYFRKTMEEDFCNDHAFSGLIGYFDHHLIKDYICNVYPELNRLFYPCWQEDRQRYLQLLDLTTCSTLHWLFGQALPELTIRIEKVKLQRSLNSEPLQMGKSRIGGDAVFGKTTNIAVFGRRITLVSEEEMTETRIPWPEEIKKRLQHLIFPVLSSTDLELEINLAIKSQRRWVRLESDTYLGYDQLRNGHAAYRRICLFRGPVSDMSHLIRQKETDHEL